MKNLTKQKKLDKQDQNLIYGYEDDCWEEDEGCKAFMGGRVCTAQLHTDCDGCRCSG